MRDPLASTLNVELPRQSLRWHARTYRTCSTYTDPGCGRHDTGGTKPDHSPLPSDTTYAWNTERCASLSKWCVSCNSRWRLNYTPWFLNEAVEPLDLAFRPRRYGCE